MMLTQRAQYLFALWGEAHRNPPQVSRVLPALYKPFFHRAVHQLNRTVVLDEKTMRKVLNAGYGSGRRALYGEHELVLLRFDGSATSHVGAEVQKSANLIAKLRKVLIVSLGTHEFTLHNNYIVQRHNYSAP